MAKKSKPKGDQVAVKVEALRAKIPAARATAYMNAGTNGPISLAAHEAMLAAAQLELEQGRIGRNIYPEIIQSQRNARTLFAGLLGAESSEIALTRNTTEGMNTALMGISWRPGDEVVTTQIEHANLFSALGLLAHRHGVIVRTIDIGNGGMDVLAAIERALTPRTRVIAISHVQWSTGAVMPLKEISALARQRGILTVVDAAQSAGQIPIDLHALEVDAYALAGQKWLCGPIGSGALYVRKETIGDILPTYLRYGAFDPHGFVVPPEGAARYELGGNSTTATSALVAGLTWMRDDVDMTWAYDRVATLATRLADALAGIPGVEVITPRARMAGLVSFTIAGHLPKAINDAAFERGYTIRFVDQRPGPAAVRVSTGWWCTEAEIDGLAGVIDELAATGPAN
jgi:L-cysteine/cystine lyase